MKYIIVLFVLVLIGATGTGLYLANVNQTPNVTTAPTTEFTLPNYLKLDPSITLTKDQKEMVRVYAEARSAMLRNNTSAEGFINYLHFTSPEQRDLFLLSESVLGWEMTVGSAEVKNYSDYTYLFQPLESYDNTATIVAFQNDTMWLFENIKGTINDRDIYGYVVTGISFKKDTDATFKITVNTIKEPYVIDPSELTSLTDAAGTEIDVTREPFAMPKFPTFSLARFVSSGGYTDIVPQNMSEAKQKITEYYAD